MKKFFVLIVALVVVFVAALFVVPAVVPVGTYKDQLTSAVKSATNRDLTIKGDMRLSLLPRIEIEANDIAFANMPGAATKDMVKLAKLKIELKVLPLLSGRIEVDSFVLVDPVIQIEINRQGRPNWVFAPAASSSAGASAPASSARDGAISLPAGLRLGDVRLVNGSLTYHDARTNSTQHVGRIDVKLSLPDMDAPFAADGAFTWNGKRMQVVTGIEKPKALFAGQSSNVQLKLGAETIDLEFRGAMSLVPTLDLVGNLGLKASSVREVAAWVGNPLQAPGTGFGPLTIAGKLAVNGAKVGFSNAKLGLDSIKGEGEFAIDASGAKPALRAKLELGRLDLNPYLQPEKTDAAKPAAPSAAQPAAAAAKDWSDDPIELAALRSVNADIALSAASILVRKIEVGRSALTVTLKDGRLTTDLTDLEFYKGSLKGRSVVDASGQVAAMDLNFRLTGVQAEPLLRDAAEFDRLMGAGNAEIAVTSRGRSQKQLISALNGKTSFKFENGAIRGVNLGAMIRNVGTAFLDTGTQQQTDFSELSGSFAITNGIAKNTDLMMLAPLFRLSGNGTVDLPKRTMDYRLEPKLVGTIEGQGGRAAASGIVVPVIVQGPWDNLSYKPDLAGVVRQQLQDPRAIETLRGIIGRDRPSTAPADAQTAPARPALPVNPADAIRGILGGGKN
jgi:AsmA protein